MVRGQFAALAGWLLTTNAFIVPPPAGSPQNVNLHGALDLNSRATAKGPLYGIPFERDPQFDEYGLPVEPKAYAKRDGPDFKDVFYSTVDAVDAAVTNARDMFASTVDPTMATYDPSENRLRKIQDGTRDKIESRRLFNRLGSFKNGVLDTLHFVAELPHLPRRSWDKLVTEPKERARLKKIEQRRALEETLERYYQAKNRFYDTLDVLSETGRISVKAARTIGQAVVNTPGNVQKTVDDARVAAGGFVADVQRGMDTAKGVANDVANLPETFGRNVQGQVNAVTNVWASATSLFNKAPKPPAATDVRVQKAAVVEPIKASVSVSPKPSKPAVKPPPPPPIDTIWDPAKAVTPPVVAEKKVKEEPKPTAVEALWEGSSSVAAAAKDKEEEEALLRKLEAEEEDDDEPPTLQAKDDTPEIGGAVKEEEKEAKADTVEAKGTDQA